MSLLVIVCLENDNWYQSSVSFSSQNWISDRVTGDFENQFVVDVEEGRLAKYGNFCRLRFISDNS